MYMRMDYWGILLAENGKKRLKTSGFSKITLVLDMLQ